MLFIYLNMVEKRINNKLRTIVSKSLKRCKKIVIEQQLNSKDNFWIAEFKDVSNGTNFESSEEYTSPRIYEIKKKRGHAITSHNLNKMSP